MLTVAACGDSAPSNKPVGGASGSSAGGGAAGPTPGPATSDAIDESGEPGSIVNRAASGRVTSLSGRFQPPRTAPRDPGKRAVAFLTEHAASFGVEPGAGLDVVSVAKGVHGHQVVRVARSHKGVPILGAEAIVHLDGNGVVRSVQASLPAPLDLDVAPKAARPSPSSVLVIFDPALAVVAGEPRLAWMSETGGGELGDDVVSLTDATTGARIFTAPLDDEAAQKFITCQGGRAACTKTWFTEAGKVAEGDAPAVMARAHELSQRATAWLKQALDRDSWDGAGKTVVLSVVPNLPKPAFWRHSLGTTFVRPEFVLYDALVHELGHGIVRTHMPGVVSTAMMGAIHEGFSDVLACMADGNWTIGERPGKSPLRDLAVKRHKDDLQILPAAAWAKANGWGHRHENGTVIGHAFYLMSEGCPRDGAAPKDYCKHVGIGMGRKRALHIAYATITEHLTSSASLETLRDGAVGACRASQSAFGVKLKMRPRDCGVVINAFHAIGVGRIDTDLDGLEDHRDNCANVYNPDQKSSKQDAEIGEACIRDDGTKVVTGDMGDHAVGRIERKGMRTAPMCGSAKTARIEVTTSHTIEYAAMEKKYLQVHLDKANAAGAAKKPYLTNDPTAKTRGLNCIWSKLLVSGGSIVADGLSKDASMMLQDRLRAASPGTLDNGTVQLPEHGTVATMTAEEIWQKPAPP